MNKKLLAIKILLPSLVILIIAMLTLEIQCGALHSGDGNALLFMVSVIANIIPMLAMIGLGAVTVILSILLFTAKNKLPVVIAALVALCLLLPFVGYSTFIDISALSMYAEVPIVAALTLAVNIAAMVMCCIFIHQERAHKYASTNDED